MGHIKLHNLGFRFEGRNKCSLRNISLQIEQGETLLLAGRSGSGKSTLLNCLNGLIPEYYRGELHGHIRIGSNTTSWHEMPLWQKAAVTGTVFQDPRHQFFSARVEQEVMLSLWRDSSSLENKRKSVEAILQKVGLNNFGHRLLDSLSSGEQQRVALCTALFTGADILILDEPSANLSEDGVTELQEFLRLVKETGTTIIIAEHRFAWLRSLADTLIVLDRGLITYHGDTGQLDDPDFCKDFGLRHHCDKVQNNCLQETGKKKNNGTANACALVQLGFRHKKQTTWLFRHLNMTFPQGAVTALTGRNGCGKTTLLNLLYGLYKPNEGMLVFPDPKPDMTLALQHPDLQLFASTVLSEIHSTGNKNEEWLERFDLWSLRDRHPLTLSGGEMQRLVLAIAFAGLSEGSPGLLLLDEPTSGMDGQQLMNLSREIMQMRKANHAVVVATHDKDLIQITGAVPAGDKRQDFFSPLT